MTTKLLFSKDDKVHIGLDVDKRSYVFTAGPGKNLLRQKRFRLNR